MRSPGVAVGLCPPAPDEPETTKYLLKSEEIFPKSESTPNIKKDIIFSLANNNDEKKLDLDNSDKYSGFDSKTLKN